MGKGGRPPAKSGNMVNRFPVNQVLQLLHTDFQSRTNCRKQENSRTKYVNILCYEAVMMI